MKAHVFISVLAFHVVVIAGLYLLSACSNSGSTGASSGRTTAPSTGGSIYNQYAEPNRPVEDDNLVVTEYKRPESSGQLDPAFNRGSDAGGQTSSGGDGRFAPTRPSNANNNTLAPTLNEFPEDDVLQPLTTTRVASPSVEYVVEKGDSLWKISREFDISLQELLAANGLNENSPIQVGQKLTIPSLDAGPPSVISPSGGASQSVQTEAYTVVKGDTLSRIANRFNTTISAIKAANGLSSDIIQLGQRLTIPENGVPSGGSSSPTPTLSPPASTPRVPPATGGQNTQGQDDRIVHEVEAGETPGGIAKLYGITTAQLMNDNGISDPRRIKVGQKLQIRLGTAQPAPPASRPTSTPRSFDDSVFDDLEDIPEVEVVPR